MFYSFLRKLLKRFAIKRVRGNYSCDSPIADFNRSNVDLTNYFASLLHYLTSGNLWWWNVHGLFLPSSPKTNFSLFDCVLLMETIEALMRQMAGIIHLLDVRSFLVLWKSQTVKAGFQRYFYLRDPWVCVPTAFNSFPFLYVCVYVINVSHMIFVWFFRMLSIILSAHYMNDMKR